MKNRIVVAVFAAFACLSVAQPMRAQQQLTGRWDGAIHIMGQVLTIAVHLESGAAGLSAKIDIPQQGAHGLPLSNVRYEPPHVHFELPAGPGLAVFDGQARGDSIAGDFTQAGMTGTFALARGAASPPASLPESEPPPYVEEEVTFAHGAITLAGTLTMPRTGGPHPAVVMITGSGPQNRDEEIFGFRPFRIIADHLTRNGIAVLRYDDRGVGGSTGSVSQATTQEFAEDALAGVELLTQRAEIDSRRIGLVGHSEGGIVAPLAATISDDVAFLVLLAGTAVTGEAILYAQGELINRAAGASDAAVERQRRFQRLSFDVVRADSGWDQLEAELRRQTREAVDSMTPQERAAIADLDAFLDTRVNAAIQSIKSPWFRYFLDYDPVPALRKVRVPVLAVFGEFDLQVPPSVNQEPMAQALEEAGNRDYTIRVLPKANHLFLSTETGSPSEYATMEKSFVPGFLDLMTQWIQKRMR
jgi:pimeloyl-ACP methyl ester carboxylesterase